jgi:hypothetical protein
MNWQTTFLRELKTVKEQNGDILSVYYEGKFVKQVIYFQKCTYVFIMHGILTTIQDSFFLADDGAFWVHKLTESESGY